VLRFPCLNISECEDIVRIICRASCDINDNARVDEMLYRNLVDRLFPLAQVNWRIHMGTAMLWCAGGISATKIAPIGITARKLR
jgi:hypothetical protein